MTFDQAWSLLALDNKDKTKPNAKDMARKKYRQFMKRYHPDVYKGSADANELSRKFNAAWKVIQEHFENPYQDVGKPKADYPGSDTWNPWYDEWVRSQQYREGQRRQQEEEEKRQEREKQSYFTNSKLCRVCIFLVIWGQNHLLLHLKICNMKDVNHIIREMMINSDFLSMLILQL